MFTRKVRVLSNSVRKDRIVSENRWCDYATLPTFGSHSDIRRGVISDPAFAITPLLKEERTLHKALSSVRRRALAGEVVEVLVITCLRCHYQRKL